MSTKFNRFAPCYTLRDDYNNLGVSVSEDDDIQVVSSCRSPSLLDNYQPQRQCLYEDGSSSLTSWNPPRMANYNNNYSYCRPNNLKSYDTRVESFELLRDDDVDAGNVDRRRLEFAGIERAVSADITRHYFWRDHDEEVGREDGDARISRRFSSSIARRNERERNRVKTINHTFAKLRQHLPGGSFYASRVSGGILGHADQSRNRTAVVQPGRLPGRSKRLSKFQILRSAIAYINELRGILRRSNTDENDAKNDDVDDSSVTSNDVIGFDLLDDVTEADQIDGDAGTEQINDVIEANKIDDAEATLKDVNEAKRSEQSRGSSAYAADFNKQHITQHDIHRWSGTISSV